MADNVTTQSGTLATLPASTVIATDDAGAGGHVQVIKLAISTDGSATVIPADATNGLRVSLTNASSADGGSLPAQQVAVQGYDGTNTQVLTVNSSGQIVLGASTAAIGKLAANSGVDIGDVDVTSLPALPAGNNNIGDVDVASIAAGTNLIGKLNLSPQAANGLTIFRSIDLDETEEEVKATAGQVYGWYLYNDGTSEVYVKLYNATAANVTVGTTTPVMTVPVPAGSAANVEFTNGIAFSTAITAAATTAVADADTGAPSANQCVANLFYT